MPAKPRLPDRFNLPTAVNGWIHDPDDRTSGMESKERIIDLDHGDQEDLSHEEVVEMVTDAATEWMEAYSEGEWSHPRIHEAAFHPPVGYEFIAYRINSQTTTVQYHQRDARKVDRLTGASFSDDMMVNVRLSIGDSAGR